MTAATTPAGALSGRGIVVTRPRDQALALAELIEREGGRALVFPAIAIEEVADRSGIERLVDDLHRFDIAIFISPNAAAKGLDAVRRRRELPAHLTVAAVGGGSARELERRGVLRVIVPQAGFDSEALLDLPEFGDVAGKRVVIFRGEGGRAMLGATLKARGASVEYAECYRRAKPCADIAPLLEAWARCEIDAVIATSSEGLRNFSEMLGERGREALASTPLFVPHPRIEATARTLGITSIVVTGAGDDAIVASLARHFRHDLTIQ